MIYIISKDTFGSNDVHDIQSNSCWTECVLDGYAVIPDEMVEAMLATKGCCDIVLNDEGTEVVSFTARETPSTTVSTVSFAPAGYGLGGNATNVASADDISANGYYETAISIGGYIESCIVWHNQHSPNYAEQNAVSVLGQCVGSILHRVKISGNWQPWEWVNPPMVPGVEYRTTEKFNDDSVYCQMVTINDLASNSTKIELTDDYGVRQTGLIRYTGNVWDSHASVIYWMPGNEASLSYKNGEFYLEGHDVNITHYHATLTLYYIKK